MSHVFISYSHKDKAYAQQLHKALQEEGFEVWIDDRIDYGTTWPLVIQRNLDACSAFVVVMTENAYESKWVQNEVTRAERKQKPLFILLLSGDVWLSFEAVQYENVTGGRLPSEKFYESLARVAPRKKNEMPTSALTVEPQNQEIASAKAQEEGKKQNQISELLRSRAAEVLRKPNRAFFFTVIGFTGMIVIAALGIPMLGKWFAPAPAPTATILVTLPVSTTTSSVVLPIISPVAATDTSRPTLTLTTSYTPTVTAIPFPYPTEIIDGRGVHMMLVPAGAFMMGSNIFAEEQPPHKVYLDDYYIDRYEVTNALYRKCVDAGICKPPYQTFSKSYTGYFTDTTYDNYPVIFVDWNMAKKYCVDWRLEQLPTEAQWEKAARGTDQRKYPWGDDISCNNANFWNTTGQCIGDTTPVGSYEKGKSPYNVYDMAGNVWEWVNDSYSAQYYGSLPDGFKNPLGPVQNLNAIIIRGGGWDSGVNGVRAAYRGYQSHLFYVNNLGFRCAKDLTP